MKEIRGGDQFNIYLAYRPNQRLLKLLYATRRGVSGSGSGAMPLLLGVDPLGPE